MEKDISFCKFCGQTFHYPEGEDPEEYAIEHCHCFEAQHEAQKIRYIKKAKQELKEVFNAKLYELDECYGDDVHEEVRKQLEAFLPLLSDLKCVAVTVGIPDIGKITITANSDGIIKIKRNVSLSVERKV